MMMMMVVMMLYFYLWNIASTIFAMLLLWPTNCLSLQTTVLCQYALADSIAFSRGGRVRKLSRAAYIDCCYCPASVAHGPWLANDKLPILSWCIRYSVSSQTSTYRPASLSPNSQSMMPNSSESAKTLHSLSPLHFVRNNSRRLLANGTDIIWRL